jgi:hypothetical protein
VTTPWTIHRSKKKYIVMFFLNGIKIKYFLKKENEREKSEKDQKTNLMSEMAFGDFSRNLSLSVNKHG